MHYMISEALDEYARAIREADRFQQQTMALPPAQQDWDQRNELDGIERRRKDTVLGLIQQDINEGAR